MVGGARGDRVLVMLVLLVLLVLLVPLLVAVLSLVPPVLQAATSPCAAINESNKK